MSRDVLYDLKRYLIPAERPASQKRPTGCRRCNGDGDGGGFNFSLKFKAQSEGAPPEIDPAPAALPPSRCWSLWPDTTLKANELEIVSCAEEGTVSALANSPIAVLQVLIIWFGCVVLATAYTQFYPRPHYLIPYISRGAAAHSSPSPEVRPKHPGRVL